jgi:uncharacterized membrane protein
MRYPTMTERATGETTAPGEHDQRIGFFTDAVFAIAMTLLVIEIPRPDAETFDPGHGVSKTEAFDRLWHFLAAQHNAYYAYVLAFSILWIVWRQHHALFDRIRVVSSPMIGWHFPLLLLVAFVPYATTVMGHYPDNPIAALLLGFVVWALLVCRSAIQSRAASDHVLLPKIDLRQYRANTTVSWVVAGYWTLTLALVWWTPWVEIPGSSPQRSARWVGSPPGRHPRTRKRSESSSSAVMVARG